MDSIKIFRNILIVIVCIGIALNVYLFIENRNHSKEMDAITKENESLIKENNSLKYEVENYSNTEREKYYNDLITQAERFANLAYVVNKEGYESRKNEAKEVMNETLQERFYPADTFYQDQVETNISNPKFYVEKLEKGQKKVNVIIDMNHSMKYLNTNQTDESKMFIRITFENIDGDWIAINQEDIISETKDFYNNENTKETE